jgi:penicillin-binding protein 2
MFREPYRARPVSPQLALRVGIMGGVAVVMFAVIFFRLWYLQILSGDKYLAEANQNQIRSVRIQAPRGEILDRDGVVLVDNKPGNAVQVDPAKLPHDARARQAVYKRLARTLGMSEHQLDKAIKSQLLQEPFTPATVKSDVPLDVVAYLRERAGRFPGVTVDRIEFRSYPHHDLAAHVLGYVGQVSDPALKANAYPGAERGDRVGVAGVEASYDNILRGRAGVQRVQVDSLGTPRGELRSTPPVAGKNLRLTLDSAVQRTGQRQLEGSRGGFVALDARTGAVLGLGSSPTYDPNIFSKTIKQSDLTRLNSQANGAPLLDRATQGIYPTGSTFKLITSVAALESGETTIQRVVQDNGSVRIGTQLRTNSGHEANGPVNLIRALQVSSDVYFYLLGQADDGRFAIQKWAHKLGIGHDTGIDLPPGSEGPGLLPTKKWRDRLFAKHLTDRPWSTGDNVSLAIGQGDLEADPLQMAVAYAAVANGGYVVRPHLADQVEDADGAVVQELPTPGRRRTGIQANYRQAIMQGLHQAADSPGGTSYAVFKDFPVPIAGKTGTAQVTGQPDQSWYVAMAPYPNPKYIVAFTIEQGGFGADSAAPAACQVLATLLHESGSKCGKGKATAN